MVARYPFTYFYFVLYVLLGFSILLVDSFVNLWFLIELQIVLFIAIAFSCPSSQHSSIIIYFLTQSFASLGIIFFYIVGSFHLSGYYMLMVFVMLNLGVLPFIGWYYFSVSGFPGLVMFMAITAQKVPVFLMLCSLFGVISFTSFSTIVLFLLFCVISTLFSSALGVFSSSLVSVVVWSSVSNTTWMLLSCLISSGWFLVYMTFYSMFLGLVLNGLSYSLVPTSTLVGLLCLSGLPPLPLFFMKVFIIFGVSALIPSYLFTILLFFLMIISSLSIFIYLQAISSYVITGFVSLGSFSTKGSIGL